MSKQKRTNTDNGGSEGGNRPIHTIGPFNAGGSLIEASIWENEIGSDDESKVAYAVTLRRAFHDGSEWRRTTALRPQDVPHAIEALRLAYLHCQELLAKK